MAYVSHIIYSIHCAQHVFTWHDTIVNMFELCRDASQQAYRNDYALILW